MFMNWLRNFAVYLLSSLFFTTLLLTVIATNINVVFSRPTKIESWLSQSGVYTGFVNTAIKQAKSSTGDSGGSSGISLRDAAYQQAAQTAFSPTILQKDVKNLLDGNYAWLRGKTAKPSFVIDLSSAKQSFSQQIGQYATSHLASLPICTYAQSLTYKNIDPLSATCRPSNISAAAEGTKVTQQIATSSGFLSNPVITADTLGAQASGNAQPSQPYYVNFSVAPRIYQWAVKAPLLLAGLSLIIALGIVFISPKRRKGLRKIGITLAFTGTILIATKLIGSIVLNKVEGKLFSNSSIGDMRQSLTAIINLLESEIAKVNLYFGIAFVLIAIAIFLGIVASHDKSGKIKALKAKLSAGDNKTAAEPSNGSQNSQGMAADINATPKSVKKPRLIQ